MRGESTRPASPVEITILPKKIDTCASCAHGCSYGAELVKIVMFPLEPMELIAGYYGASCGFSCYLFLKPFLAAANGINLFVRQFSFLLKVCLSVSHSSIRVTPLLMFILIVGGKCQLGMVSY